MGYTMNQMYLKSLSVLVLGSLTACTGQLLDSFRYQNAKESFVSQSEINTKIDLLWVVDNSSSMDIAQKNFRDKVAGFADQYLSPNWDIRIGVITTDAYLANPVFETYLNSQVAGSVGFRSVHLNTLITERLAQDLDASNDSKLATLESLGVSFNLANRGTFVGGYRFKDLVPAWSRGADYARLIAGVRDGPISGLCIERQSYFFAKNIDLDSQIIGPDCALRDSTDTTGSASCLNPSTGESSVSECVNTSLNDTIRTTKPILKTKTPSSFGGSEAAWKEELARDFKLNISVGSVGGGSERGLSSIAEFIDVNEVSASQFFRKDSLRAIIIVSDEDDQSLTLPALDGVPENFEPFSNYQCDLDALVEANADKFDNALEFISTTFAYCCDGDSCRFKNLGCPSKMVDGQEVKVGVCPDPNSLANVDSFKQKLSEYFYGLDEKVVDEETTLTAKMANYFVVSIVPTQLSVLNSMRAERNLSDDRLDDIQLYDGWGALTTTPRLRIPAVDYGERYIQFSNSVGNGSISLDIGAEDYAVVLDHIGKALVEKKSKFDLKFSPTQKSDIVIKIIRENGQETNIEHAQYEFDDKTLTVTDETLILGLKIGDQIFIDYQPSSLNE